MERNGSGSEGGPGRGGTARRGAGRWLPVGFPNGSARASAMACATSGRNGVVAPWSRYVEWHSLM